MIKKSFSKHKLLIGIILIAALLRFIGTIPGYPPIHTDEGISHSQGIAMILERSLDPKYGYGTPYNYPIIVPLINAFFYLVIFIPIYVLGFVVLHINEVLKILESNNWDLLPGIFDKNILGSGRINVVFWGRLITAFFGTGIVLITYLLSKRLFLSKAIGLLAAFFVAIDYRQVLNSHFGLPDIYNAFFLLVSLYLTLLLWEKQSLKRYILAGIGVAIYFSTKFQFFAIFPLLLVLIFLAIGKKNWHRRLNFFLNRHIFFLIAVIVVIAIILNIFHIIHWQETLDQIGYSALKYRYGRNILDIYSISYLYYIGLGKFVSILILTGMFLGVSFNHRKILFLLTAIAPFLWMMVYYTGGGYYTRNFVTITPLLLICTAYAICQIFELLRKFSSTLAILLCSLLILLVSFQSLSNSYLVPLEYSKNWNYTEVQLWLGKNLPRNAIVLTDASMVLPQKNLQIIKARSIDDYSLTVLQKKGVEWAVINTAWFSDEFLWWMQGDIKNGLKYWNKPTSLMLNSSTVKILLELKKYIVFEALNPWQVPDNNYLVIKVPQKDKQKNFFYIRSKFNPEEHLFLNSNGGM